MSSATLEAPPIFPLFNAIACGLCLAQLTFASEESRTTKVSDEAFLQSVQSSEQRPPIGAFFASIIKSQEQIEFLAGRKRYKDLFKEMEGFRNTLNQTSTVLPEHERQRAARFHRGFAIPRETFQSGSLVYVERTGRTALQRCGQGETTARTRLNPH